MSSLFVTLSRVWRACSYKKQAALSKDLARRKAILESEGYQAWVTARGAEDFSLFAPKLREWVALTREMCAAVEPESAAYDVTLDTFEKGMKSARIDTVFEVRDHRHCVPAVLICELFRNYQWACPASPVRATSP